MSWKVDFTNDTEETLDAIQPLPGWYRATVFDIQEDDKTGAMLLDFKITGPGFIGAMVQDRVWSPENADTEDKALKSMQRAKKVMKRMGLATKDVLGKEVDIDWQEAVGREMIVKVIDDSFPGRDGKPVHKIGLGYLGMYPLDHAEIPPAERVKLGLPLLPGQELPAPAPATGEAPKTPGRKPRASKPAPTPPEDIDVDNLVANLNL